MEETPDCLVCTHLSSVLPYLLNLYFLILSGTVEATSDLVEVHCFLGDLPENSKRFSLVNLGLGFSNLIFFEFNSNNSFKY